jgi:hypothetical protein
VRDVTDGAPSAPPPTVTPVDTDGVRTVAVGTALWALALVLLLPFRGRLEEAGNGWWLWTCVAGTGLGLLGLEYTRRRRDAIARVRRYRAGETDEQDGDPPTGAPPAAPPTNQDGSAGQNGSAASPDS